MKLIIDTDKQISELKDMLNNLTDAKDLQSVRFAINIFEYIDGIPFDSVIEDIKREILEESTIDYPICDEIFEIIDKHLAEV